MIDFKADVINTREIIERIDELELEYTIFDGGPQDGEMLPRDQWPAVDRQEWQGLTDLIEAVGAEARHGVTLIHENYFRDYVKDWHADTYDNRYQTYNRDTYSHEDVTWTDLMSTLPFSCIDWDEVAEECRSDYSVAEIDGATFYYMA